ncbi:RES domain-containing protein [Tardiphaga alba]|uniref:RES domain-containing protein n=1 Tax=Tardiphaga alba TaxID=340268 RepID=A0ABX8AG19_9BRAD|nr:RES family NAD+ phosphorylase [Tardiphaga alba]QUS41265.1 RES domain-containing protein [Tardiphaga alba]
MELWRISNYPDLSGIGGLRFGGRWHSEGRRIVYLADHPSSALLEMIVHLDFNFAPASYQLLRVRAEDKIKADQIDAADLPMDWLKRIDVTRAMGDSWLNRSANALLQVPSAIVRPAKNYLLNPLHSDAPFISIIETITAPFDPRLWRSR